MRFKFNASNHALHQIHSGFQNKLIAYDLYHISYFKSEFKFHKLYNNWRFCWIYSFTILIANKANWVFI